MLCWTNCAMTPFPNLKWASFSALCSLKRKVFILADKCTNTSISAKGSYQPRKFADGYIVQALQKTASPICSSQIFSRLAQLKTKNTKFFSMLECHPLLSPYVIGKDIFFIPLFCFLLPIVHTE